jgi:hypothetical protein
VSWDVAREQENVDEAFAALWAVVWILSTVLQDHMTFKLILPPEFLLALRATVWKLDDMCGLKVPVHV